MLTKLILAVLVAVSTVESLQCLYGGHGTVNGRSGSAKEKNVTCKSNTQFCVSLDSDVTLQGEHVIGVAKGCDTEMPGSIPRTFCTAEGCTKQEEKSGSVVVCCCKSDYCNAATGPSTVFSAMIIPLVLFLAFTG